MVTITNGDCCTSRLTPQQLAQLISRSDWKKQPIVFADVEQEKGVIILSQQLAKYSYNKLLLLNAIGQQWNGISIPFLDSI